MFAHKTVYHKPQPACFAEASESAIPLVLLTAEEFSDWLAGQAADVQRWVRQQRFTAQAGTDCSIPGEQGQVAQILVGVDTLTDLAALARLPAKLAPQAYRLATPLTHEQQLTLALGWGMACYRFTLGRQAEEGSNWPKLQLPAEVLAQAAPVIEAVHYVRDLINQPANILHPDALTEQAQALADTYKADCHVIVGEKLLRQNFPAIYAVGQAGSHPPQLIDLRWGKHTHPKVILVGKGVCFDSGGLNLKPGNSMRLMKKDMGGAAHALGLAKMIMQAQLPIQLQVLIPAVENAVGSQAYRPGDVLTMRDGTTVEIDNTDAEGRLVVADALSFACEQQPELIIDFATLTGAARVALGPDVPVLFTNQDALAGQLAQHAEQTQDPLWRLPLVTHYRQMLDSEIADMTNSAASPFAGAITAALFLQHFVTESITWAHIDLMAWNPTNRPAHPQGGEAMAMRAIFDYLAASFPPATTA
jgi:leucyl aminopeptidase